MVCSFEEGCSLMIWMQQRARGLRQDQHETPPMNDKTVHEWATQL
jgi:hypothetical protein